MFLMGKKLRTPASPSAFEGVESRYTGNADWLAPVHEEESLAKPTSSECCRENTFTNLGTEGFREGGLHPRHICHQRSPVPCPQLVTKPFGGAEIPDGTAERKTGE